MLAYVALYHSKVGVRNRIGRKVKRHLHAHPILASKYPIECVLAKLDADGVMIALRRHVEYLAFDQFDPLLCEESQIQELVNLLGAPTVCSGYIRCKTGSWL